MWPHWKDSGFPRATHSRNVSRGTVFNLHILQEETTKLSDAYGLCASARHVRFLIGISCGGFLLLLLSLECYSEFSRTSNTREATPLKRTTNQEFAESQDTAHCFGWMASGFFTKWLSREGTPTENSFIIEQCDLFNSYSLFTLIIFQ